MPDLSRRQFGASLGLALAAPRVARAQARADLRALRVVPNASLSVLDPIVTTAGIVQSHGMMVYDFLFGRDDRLQPKPQMVREWSVSDDNLRWTFVLRDGLRFHDGQPVTSRDVVASLRRWGARDPYGRQIIAVTGALDATDDRTVTWRLTRPYGLMLEALSKSGGAVAAIMPERLARTDPFTPVTDPTGSGPFMFARDEWVVGSKAVYRRNPDYVPRDEPAEGTAGGKRVLVDRVEWLTIPDAQTAASALVQGELDYLETPQLESLPLLQRRGMQTRVTNQLGFQGMIRPNFLFPPFDNEKARQALLYLANQQDYLNVMFPDPSVGRECHAFFVCGSPLETEAGWQPGFGRDQARARRLMQEAGYDGRPVVLLQASDPPFLNAATLLLADQLKSIGVNVDLQPMDFAAMAQRRVIKRPPSEGGWNLLLTYWNGLGASDPVGNVPMQTNGDNAWPGWPSNAAHQAMIDAYPYAPTTEARQALATQIQESAYRIVPYVQFAQWTAPVAYRPTLKGVIGAPQVLVLWNIEKTG